MAKGVEGCELEVGELPAFLRRGGAQAMRRILLNRYRDKQRLKRGGAHEHVSADELPVAAPVPDEQLEAMDEALTRLAAAEPLVAEVVNLRWFAGLKWSEIADVTGVPERELNRL